MRRKSSFLTCGVSFVLTPQAFECDEQRDAAIYEASRRLTIGLLNAGLKPFGIPKLQWRSPNIPYNDPFHLIGFLTQRGAEVTPVRPEEWDVYEGWR